MRKVGATSSGNVLIEMNLAQYEALKQVVDPKSASASSPPGGGVDKTMAVKRKLDHIRSCVQKLRPDTRDKLIQAIRSVHAFSGAYANKEIDHLLRILVREKLLVINADDSIDYSASSMPGELLVQAGVSAPD